jgi:S-phase kinase-associated protein 1
MPNVKLQSSDGEVFDVDVDVAKVSMTIKNMLEGEFLKQAVIL